MKNIVYLLVLLAIGCQNNQTSDITLNDGQKWQVNREMALHFEAMEADIAKFQTGDDLAELQSRLKTNISDLTTKCTMKGQAHDELHKWLVPFIDEVNAMQTDNPTGAIEKLRGQFDNYHLYFVSES